MNALSQLLHPSHSMVLKNVQEYVYSLTHSLTCSLGRPISNIFGVLYDKFLLSNIIYGLSAYPHFQSSQSERLHFSLTSSLLTKDLIHFCLFPSNHITQLVQLCNFNICYEIRDFRYFPQFLINYDSIVTILWSDYRRDLDMGIGFLERLQIRDYK
jgi:hypothetical protein